MEPTFHALIDYNDPYVLPLIHSALSSHLPDSSFRHIESAPPQLPAPSLQFRDYEAIDFETALRDPEYHLINAYIIRKALIRKHFLSTTISSWITKHPASILKEHFKPAVDFELDYAEFLDDALVEAFELRESFEKNDGKEPAEREWWILKPGMSDRGQGIRLFSTEEELQAIFEEWEAERPDSDDEDDLEEEPPLEHQDDIKSSSMESKENGDYIITSQLRHFIAQPYIHPPLLLPSEGNRKFHIRTYVLSVGALKVYVYKPMLALFAAEPYAPPWEDSDLRAHLTNTCLQDTGEREGSVRAFWSLPDEVILDGGASEEDWKNAVFEQICNITGEVFEASARGMMVHFQPLPNAFELFGLDFLVDANGTAWLLEINAFPDFRQTGEELKDLVQGLFEDTISVAVKPFFGMGNSSVPGTARMTKVLDIDLGRR
ncbi:tubulin-tyrosine ligase [Rhizodiscina lignyota]|uniref:Tubulin-tyrosine ligase n=1 Tax=Rhizodiscina lignyota TaxID=1504668 RepID=A0A9P4IDG0_9PEZI|nr:tubulin-tyrosine ligase [Rhizodiscina lignyota]